MSDIQANGIIDIESKIKEAEVYQSMGLIAEAIVIHEQILSDVPELDSHEQEKIREKIELLKEKDAVFEKELTQELSSEDLSYIKEALDIDEDVSAVRNSAKSFKELGLFVEAASEYEKLFKLGCPVTEIIPGLTECYLEVHPPDEVINEIERVIDLEELGELEKGDIMLMFGLEMEKGGHNAQALKLYQSAGDIDSENEEIKNRISFMMSSLKPGSRYDYLLDQEMMTTDQLKKALELSKKTNKSVEFILIDQFKVKKEEVGKSLSLFYGCSFKRYKDEIITPVELIGKLKQSFLLHEIWVPLSWDEKGVEVLIDDPRDVNKTDFIKGLLKTKKLIFSVGIKEDIEAFIKRFYSTKSEDPADISEVSDESVDYDDLMPDVFFEEEEEVEEVEVFDEASGKIVRLIDHIIVAAYRKNASDIHIEPSPVTNNLTIRFRVDGLCHEYMSVPNTMARALLSRVKIMARLDIAERRLPQDGKIKFKRKEGIPPFELRLATLPSAGGFEDAVLRVLASAGAMKIDDMRLTARNLKIMKKIISQPYGLILAVGPTGSGKTTSLHAALGHINKPDIKIWTAEDPVEITQIGLRQVEAKPQIGLDFARIMRSFLRADPDVIMIGEMRDEETASIGVEASLTGHLVFSTLHTNSAPETVTRLLDMGLNPLNFSDAFLGVLAQRLVRRLCSECREGYHPTEEEFEEIVTDYGKEDFEATGIEYKPDLTLYRLKGCDVCLGTGYKGRLGIHELMDGTPEIKRMIKKQAATELLFEQAVKDGMTNLKQDGILKVFQGLTDMKEVRRVCVG